MYREERDFYELTVGEPGSVPAGVEELHNRVSAILHKLSPGRLHVQTMALIATLGLEQQEQPRVKHKAKPTHAKRTA